ncbi:MAG: hypothetical protein PQ612_09085 [Rickettsiales bacterium]|nr:hypothetical protein [Pseudomonadota bacterium]MDA0967212.1 hypothetical protein [Pseudomonadota bacterium]MDG4544127.1 hypothetical protein [Rickettsiales bacterium]MDG4546308.1 hypothetical protein [Rickettsiales bacterium]MDG4548451.1 hypothetical protein [Rickettsiales bacterium]
MKESVQNKESTELRVVALYSIKNKYKKLVMGDPILKHDFNTLVKYTTLSEPNSAKHCEKIINHLIAEIYENVEDDQRMDDESPVSCKDDAILCKRFKEHLGLKQALEEYFSTYLTKV